MAGRGDRAASGDGALAQRLTPSSARGPAARRRARRAFVALESLSFFHSCVYLGLLICAFAAGKPQPETFVLGMAHGLLWIFMSLACIAAARARVVPMRLAVAVAVLGGIGPFFGSAEFVRAQRRGQAPAGDGERLTVSAP
ncbi:MAG: hypothetical protein ACYCU0_15810 [Solirubrobacteraceae bacterium]